MPKVLVHDFLVGAPQHLTTQCTAIIIVKDMINIERQMIGVLHAGIFVAALFPEVFVNHFDESEHLATAVEGTKREPSLVSQTRERVLLTEFSCQQLPFGP